MGEQEGSWLGDTDTGTGYVAASTSWTGPSEVYRRYEPESPDGRDCQYCGSYVSYDRIKSKGTCQNCGGTVRFSDPIERTPKVLTKVLPYDGSEFKGYDYQPKKWWEFWRWFE